MASSTPLLSLSSVIRDQLSGTVLISSEKIVRQFVFQAGHLSNAVSNAKSELPGTFLHKEGKMTSEGYNQYLAKLKTPKPNLWGEALDISKLPPMEISGLKAKYAVALSRAAIALPSASVQMTPADPSKLDSKIADGVRFLIDTLESFPAAEIAKICPDFDEKSSIFLDAATEKKFSPLPLSPEEKGLLTVILHNQLLSEVFSSSFLGKERISRMILVFWLIGLVKLEGQETVARKAHEKTLTPEDKKVVQRLRNLRSSLDQTSYYQWLGVAPSTPPDQIQDAFRTQIEFLSTPSLPKLFYGEEKGIPDMLITKLQEAAKVLLNTEQKQEYDSFLASGKTGSFSGMSKVGKELEVLQEVLGLSQKDPMKALGLLEKELAKGPDSIRLIVEYVKVAIAQFQNIDAGQKGKILQYLEKGASFSSPSSEFFELQGLWMEKMDRSKDAVVSYQKALALWPFSKVATEGLDRLMPNESGRIAVQSLYQNIGKWNYYQILGLKDRSNVKEIQKAYRDCTKRFHPDRFFRLEDPELKSQANQIYKEMVKAYTTLKNNEKRSEYDRSLSS